MAPYNAFEVILGGLAPEVKDDIPCPDKPVEQWTEEEHEAFFLYCWEQADDGTTEYVVKSLKASAEAIENALDILERIREDYAAAAKRTGYRNEFDHETLPFLLQCLRQRVKDDKASKGIPE